MRAEAVLFCGERYTYVFLPASRDWQVRQEVNPGCLSLDPSHPYVYKGPEGTWCFDGMVEDDKGILRCWKGKASMPGARRGVRASPGWRSRGGGGTIVASSIALQDACTLQETRQGPPRYPVTGEPEGTGIAAFGGFLWISLSPASCSRG